MNKKTLDEIRKETEVALNNKVLSLKKELIKISMPSLGKESYDIKKIRSIRKEIAQILTIVSEKKHNTGSEKKISK